MEKLSKLIKYQNRLKFKKFNKDFVVYKITNTINSKVYIGITKQIIKRIGNHIYYFKNPNSNNNTYLHKALRKYGLENFTIEILEICNSLEELNNKEIYWISELQSTNSIFGYNLDSGGNLKEPNKQNILNRQLNAKVKPVAQYDLKGNLIQTFYSVKEASRQLNISDSDIHRCHRKNWSRNGFMFKKFESKPLDKIDPYQDKTGKNLVELTKGKLPHNAIACKAVNLKTGEIYEAKSLLELSEKLCIHKTTIYRILNNKKHKKWKITLQEYQ
jgi:group I intron endonuclease